MLALTRIGWSGKAKPQRAGVDLECLIEHLVQSVDSETPIKDPFCTASSFLSASSPQSPLCYGLFNLGCGLSSTQPAPRRYNGKYVHTTAHTELTEHDSREDDQLSASRWSDFCCEAGSQASRIFMRATFKLQPP